MKIIAILRDGAYGGQFLEFVYRPKDDSPYWLRIDTAALEYGSKGWEAKVQLAKIEPMYAPKLDELIKMATNEVKKYYKGQEAFYKGTKGA